MKVAEIFRSFRAELDALLRNRSGAVILYVTAGLTVFVGFSALAIDGSYLYVMHNRMQSAADAAALAAASQLPDADDTRAAAVEYAVKNLPTGENGVVLKNSDVVLGTWDDEARTFTAGASPANAVQVTVRRAAENENATQLFLASMFGEDSVDMSATATATFGTAGDWDMTIVQDVSNSFRDEIHLAREADKALMSCVADRTGPGSRIGITKFTGNAFFVSEVPPEPIAENLEAYEELVDDIEPCCPDNSTSASTRNKNCNKYYGGNPQCVGTHIGAGIDKGLQVVDAMEAADAAADDDDGEDGDDEQVVPLNKALVIVSDGEPNAAERWKFLPSYGGTGDPLGSTFQRLIERGRYSQATDILYDKAEEAADRAEDRGVDIFTIYYYEDGSDSDREFLEGLTRGNGQYFETPDAEDLPNLLLKVCSSLPLKLVM
jgi:Flp pilus assembly protein TadG